MITVFYDGKCGICSKEIDYYRKLSPDGIFMWQDVNQAAKDLKQEGINLTEGLKFLHAKDNNGKLHVGINAFILIWQQLGYWRILAKLISYPILRQVTDNLYRVFATWRFKRLDHCQIALKEESQL